MTYVVCTLLLTDYHLPTTKYYYNIEYIFSYHFTTIILQHVYTVNTQYLRVIII